MYSFQYCYYVLYIVVPLYPLSETLGYMSFTCMCVVLRVVVVSVTELRSDIGPVMILTINLNGFLIAF